MKQGLNNMTHADCLEKIQSYSNQLSILSKSLEPETTKQIMLELEQLLMYAQNNHNLQTLELGLNFHRLAK